MKWHAAKYSEMEAIRTTVSESIHGICEEKREGIPRREEEDEMAGGDLSTPLLKDLFRVLSGVMHE